MKADNLSELEKLIYEQGSQVCMHYEKLRRQGLSFLGIVQTGLIYIVTIRATIPDPLIVLFVPIIGIGISFVTYNNDLRVIGYYDVYMGRLCTIEKTHGANFYDGAREMVNKSTKSGRNNFYFRSIPNVGIVFWALYLGTILSPL